MRAGVYRRDCIVTALADGSMSPVTPCQVSSSLLRSPGWDPGPGQDLVGGGHRPPRVGGGEFGEDVDEVLLSIVVERVEQTVRQDDRGASGVSQAPGLVTVGPYTGVR